MDQEHPLVSLVAKPSVPFADGPEAPPTYNPSTQMQIIWENVTDHMEILCSSDRTGDPDTRSATTEWEGGTSSDDDTDDSGT